MTRSTWTAALPGSLTCLMLAALAPSACASEQTAEPDASQGATGNVDRGGKPGAGSGGKATSFGGASTAGTSSTTGGRAGGSGGTEADAGEPGSAGEASANGGMAPADDKCETTSDCKQVAGSCFVCEAVGTIKDCVDQGPPVCDDGELDPCEVCEIDDVKPCTELGKPGDFSGGSARCKATCDGWDTSTCSVCGNGKQEEGEQCDGADPTAPHTCADEDIAENPDRPLPCTDECRYDTTLCSGCSKGAEKCLDGGTCSADGCSGSECKVGTSCDIDCGGGGKSCDDVQCNHDATCAVSCNNSAHCTNLVCDSGATCKLDCSGGGSRCDGTVCKAGAKCELDCDTSGSCRNVDCRAGSECDVSCNGGGSVCSGTATCGPGSTCDFGCSESGNCAGLLVTCQKDSICHFTCTSGGSVCPKARCEAGAVCVFDCAGGSCNSPECANEDDCTGN